MAAFTYVQTFLLGPAYAGKTLKILLQDEDGAGVNFQDGASSKTDDGSTLKVEETGSDGHYDVWSNQWPWGSLPFIVVVQDNADSSHIIKVAWNQQDFLDQTLAATESNIRGSDSDDLKDISDQLDTAQADLDSPSQYKADVSALATSAELADGTVVAGTVSDKTGYSLSAAGIQAMWDALTSALTTAGSIGKLLADNIDTALSSLSTFDSSSDTVDVGKISGSSTAADNLEASAKTIVTGAATATTLTITQMSTNLTEATDDHYNGRIIIWTSGTLKDQATDITGYDGSTKTLTFTAITEVPQAGDTFVIV